MPCIISSPANPTEPALRRVLTQYGGQDGQKLAQELQPPAWVADPADRSIRQEVKYHGSL